MVLSKNSIGQIADIRVYFNLIPGRLMGGIVNRTDALFSDYRYFFSLDSR